MDYRFLCLLWPLASLTPDGGHPIAAMNIIIKLFLPTVVALLLPNLSRADVVFALGNNPQPGEENVLLNGGTVGNTISGNLNQSGIQVNFTSGSTLTAPSNGQARIEATSAGSQVALSDVSFSLANNATFTDAIFNMFVGGTIGDSGGIATINATTTTGVSQFNFSLGNGQNFLTITAINGQELTDISILTDIGFTDLRQVRISGATAIPEPGVTTLCVVGATVLGLAFLRRRRTCA